MLQVSSIACKIAEAGTDARMMTGDSGSSLFNVVHLDSLLTR